MLGVAVVGCGYWGPKVIRNFQAFDDCEVRAVFDLDAERIAAVRKTYPAIHAAQSFRELLDAPDIEAIVLCTPVHTHHPLATAVLQADKHVLVEKPLTASVESAEALVELADTRRRTLQVDHTFVYSGAVRKLGEIMQSGRVGQILYLDFVRVNLGLFQSDINVLWDLGPHDLSILAHLIDRRPRWVSAVGSAHYGKLEDQAYVTVQYDDALLAHLHVNWLAPVKIRSTLIGGSHQMIVYNDLEPSEKIRVYDKGVTLADDPRGREQTLVDYRTGDMFAPHIDKAEPLERMCRSFVEACTRGTPSQTDGKAGLAVVRILEAAQHSIRKGGERVSLEPPR